jgi:hypothetical protein
MKSNYQTFEEKGFLLWVHSFREIVIIITILHLLKYPISTVEYVYENKFGIDIPMFGGLNASQQTLIQSMVGAEAFELIKGINQKQKEQVDFMNWLESLPDLSEDEKQEIIINLDKSHIEQMGFNEWIKQGKKIYRDHWDSEEIQGRIHKLKKWAKEMNYMDHKLQRLKA